VPDTEPAADEATGLDQSGRGSAAERARAGEAVQSEAEQGEVGQNGATAEDEPRPGRRAADALRTAPGDWYVVHSYAGYENK